MSMKKGQGHIDFSRLHSNWPMFCVEFNFCQPLWKMVQGDHGNLNMLWRQRRREIRKRDLSGPLPASQCPPCQRLSPATAFCFPVGLTRRIQHEIKLGPENFRIQKRGVLHPNTQGRAPRLTFQTILMALSCSSAIPQTFPLSNDRYWQVWNVPCVIIPLCVCVCVRMHMCVYLVKLVPSLGAECIMTEVQCFRTQSGHSQT